MQADDKIQFLKVLNGMASMKKATLLPEVLDLWWGCMADWNIDDFKAAAIHVMKNAQFMPTPADFEALRKAGNRKAGEAWDLAVQHAASGRYRNGAIGDALIDQCVRIIGGYATIAMSDVTKLQFIERRFCEHYDTLEEAHETRLAVPQIAKPDWLQLKFDNARKLLTR